MARLPFSRAYPPLAALSCLIIFTCSVPVFAQNATPPPETPQQKAQRMDWWAKARFGMFIHWGIYAVPADGEWYMNNAHVPRDQYAQYAKQFDPIKFNADQWVQLAKAAGMKYLVITSKHHDGFCMFRTSATHYNVVDDTPWRQDPLAALSRACQKYGIRFGTYYSIMDWHSPDQAPADPNPTHPTYNPTHFVPGEKQAYIKYVKTQLAELIHQYHTHIIWFDGGWMQDWNAQDGIELYNYLRRLDPSLIINNREQGAGDFGTPEQQIGGHAPPGQYWETCMTINHNWGYNQYDKNFKSVTQLIHTLVTCASGGGNLLLNIGPRPDGTIQPSFVTRLLAMGKWLRKNGASIYGTEESPWVTPLSFGGCTTKGNTLYLHVFSPAPSEIALHQLKNRVRSVKLLVGGSALPFHQSGEDVTIQLPQPLPDPIDTVVEVALNGKPRIDNAIHPSADGNISLTASTASVIGSTAHYENIYGKDDIGYWVNEHDRVEWSFLVPKASLYRVTITYACANGNEGSTYEIREGRSALKGEVKATGSWGSFIRQELGTIKLRAGRQVLEVVPTRMPNGAVMNLHRIQLEPVKLTVG